MALPPRKSDPLEGLGALAESRPEQRPELRDITPQLAAERRAAEIMEHADGFSFEAEDKFYVDPADIPTGWDYNWKTKTVYNQENPAYQVALARTGWTAVPRTRHPSYMPHDSKSLTIERDGQILMERPLSITEMVLKRDRQRARDQVRFKEEQLGQPGPGQFERTNKDASLVKVNKSYSPSTIPD